MSAVWIKRCRDCGRHFRTPEYDRVMCLSCLFVLMAEDEPDNDPRSEYAETIMALPASERRRLVGISNNWAAPDDGAPHEHDWQPIGFTPHPASGGMMPTDGCSCGAVRYPYSPEVK